MLYAVSLRYFCIGKMMDKIALIFLLIFTPLLVYPNKFQNIPDYYLRLEERIVKHGYPMEVHQIITDDGYIIAAYRIPHGLKKEQPDNKNKSAILIINGMGGTPHNFLVLGKKRAAPYYFADRGMDVWLFQARGGDTPFKKHHVKLDWNKDSEYWMHSFHELGVYDLAATIDYILKCTGQEKVTLIGHSAGGNEYFVLLSEKPEYNRKVKLTIAWGSAPILRRLDFPIAILGIHLGPIAKGLIKFLKMTELIPSVLENLKPVLIETCLKNDPFWNKLFRVFLYFVGSHKSVMTLDEYVCIIASNLSRMSSMQPIHFIDNTYNGTFRKYDFGPKGNLKRYGQTEPPHYNLSAVTAPTAFFSAKLDGEITLDDVYESMASLPNTIFLHRIPFYRFNHLDYIFGYNATELVYEPTYQLIKKIDSGIIPPRVKVP